jgi:phosphoribosylformimino-5-aminoimidazole carboxamide ribotide isomerase
MQIIPVIDLKNGIVVHAKQGNRELYAPLQSGLCISSNIFAVIDVYRTVFNFSTIYVADLNAIAHQSNNVELLSEVLATFPEISFWVDGGYPLRNEDLLGLVNFLPVLGSESFADENIHELRKFSNNFILSLDYSQAGELGAKILFATPDLWPENIIIMSLPRVGSNLGPEVESLTTYRKQFPCHNFIAAGGVRHKGDLQALKQIGIEQVLVATALHNGALSFDDIADL